MKDFPGLHRPGLIEACSWSAMRRRRGAFRAFIGPVSLKLLPQDGEPWFVAAFPGLHRPGLIEARWCWSWSRTRSRFPGLHRPGLIEAMKLSGS